MGTVVIRYLPLTKRVQALDFVSRGLAILSHKGRGKAGAAPRVYLSPCGRGYAGRVNVVNPWPKLVRGESPSLSAGGTA